MNPNQQNPQPTLAELYASNPGLVQQYFAERGLVYPAGHGMGAIPQLPQNQINQGFNNNLVSSGSGASGTYLNTQTQMLLNQQLSMNQMGLNQNLFSQPGLGPLNPNSFAAFQMMQGFQMNQMMQQQQLRNQSQHHRQSNPVVLQQLAQAKLLAQAQRSAMDRSSTPYQRPLLAGPRNPSPSIRPPDPLSPEQEHYRIVKSR